MDWSQISAGGRQTLCVVSAGASRSSIRGSDADAGSIGPLGLASGKQTLVDWHCAPVLHALPVFAVVSASLQQSSCCACVDASNASCAGCCMGHGGSTMRACATP